MGERHRLDGLKPFNKNKNLQTAKKMERHFRGDDKHTRI